LADGEARLETIGIGQGQHAVLEQFAARRQGFKVDVEKAVETGTNPRGVTADAVQSHEPEADAGPL
jgi:hypothetical protein